MAIAHADLLDRLVPVARGRLETIVALHGMTTIELDGVRIVGAEAMAGHDGAALADIDVAPWTTQSIMLTSGTTGPSKGVVSSYLHLYEMGRCLSLADAGDRFLVTGPLFHAGATLAVYRMLRFGASIAVVQGFKTDTFWQTVHAYQATAMMVLGVMAGFINKSTPGEDRPNGMLRWMIAGPYDAAAIEFGRRFDVRVITTFNMTEISSPIVSGVDPGVPMTCGNIRPGLNARLVDEHDCEVPDGTVGELIVRTDLPWAMNSGYHRNPEATAQAWRNGWFHTGDALRKDENGLFFYVDRIKDAIRRRGENISSFEVEVEAEVLAHPAVREAAAIAVPAATSEDDVLVAISLREGATLNPRELIEFLVPRMAHFMIPRYVRVMADLPKTPTNKIQKNVIWDAGVTAETWDREAERMMIRRVTPSAR